ncbi:hypothetical protein H4S02_000587 [Coemansia sp. RSA 2611]|nr:hypothetical protein IWW52_000569 [Coemansia sp. RSA 2704]KAJ2368411.1 hypothetical protein H4S01_001609 [Coemansia sp. RSA 2610]KAJ2392792.1 hypothetical protein H4S02_000587 [Coemansia sp. RSA 2611]KAJ2739347.1 hypothetical protein H4R23_000531 [Coemansia sp. Cherry 401B]
MPTTRALSKGECTELYNSSPALVELREYALTHTLDTQSQTAAPAKPTKVGKQDASSLPIVSLRDMANSLLEETRFEDGVRFLATAGSPQLLQDAKVVASLLSIFKPTHLIEEDLQQRSAYLLDQAKAKNADYSELWRIGNDRRRTIVQSQQSVLSYLASTEIQFMKTWFDDIYAAEPDKFWDYFDQLTALPQSSASQITSHLELEMYTNRMTVACLLLEQMNADMAANLADIRSSMFVKVVSSGMTRARIVQPTELLDRINATLGAISSDRCAHEEAQLATRLLDLLAPAIMCGAIASDPCVYSIARFLGRKSCADRTRFLNCIQSDQLAIKVIDQMILTQYKVSTGKRGPGVDSMLVSPPSIAKTAFCLRYARVPPSKVSAGRWHDFVCLLSALVQRTMRAYSCRVCRVNEPRDEVDSERPALMLLTNHSTNANMLFDAYQELRGRIAEKLPAAQDSESDDSVDELRMLYTELDLLGSYCSSYSE